MGALLCARLWRVDCVTICVCDKLTVWRHDCVTSWLVADQYARCPVCELAYPRVVQLPQYRACPNLKNFVVCTCVTGWNISQFRNFCSVDVVTPRPHYKSVDVLWTELGKYCHLWATVHSWPPVKCRSGDLRIFKRVKCRWFCRFFCRRDG